MIHFVRSGGLIPASHLDYLIRHFEVRGIEHVVHDTLVAPDEVHPGHAYVSCDMNLDRVLYPHLAQVFSIQLPHNLTVVKGSDFKTSHAQLNVLAGRAQMSAYRADGDPRFVIGGYSKWDLIYPERFRQQQRRAELSERLGLRAELPWVVFYPTGPNRFLRSTLHLAPRIYARLCKRLGPHEFILCDHDLNQYHDLCQLVIEQVRALSLKHGSVHIVDGAETLPFISACDLFITDVASSVTTAMSMSKPILFVRQHCTPSIADKVRWLQAGTFFDQVEDVGSFIRCYETPPQMQELFSSIIEYDDDENRERITSLILEAVERWRSRS